MTDTYGGWTAEEIEAAEFHGDYIPQNVLTDYVNGDTDEDREYERSLLLNQHLEDDHEPI